MKELVVAVDLGGTQLRVAVYDHSYRPLARHAEPTRAEEGPESALKRMVAAVRRLGDGVGWDRVCGIGVSAPGPLDPRKGVIHWAPNLPGWREVPLVSRLSEALGWRVLLGNDGNLAALAEQRRGAGTGCLDMVYITVSTGVGGGVISDGQLIVGHGGLASEVGHMTLEAAGPRCNCGNIGCLEALASGTAIARQARELISAGARTRIGDLVGGDLERITAKVVHEAARAGDVVAVDLFRKAGMYLGIGIVNLMYLFNPGVVVVGGGVSKAGDLLFVPMQATIRQRIDEIYWANCPVVRAQLGDDVCLVGAAILAREGLEREGTGPFSAGDLDRSRLEEQLLKLSRAVEQSPSTVVITDLEGNIEYVNPKFSQVTGYSPEEVIGHNPRLLKAGDLSAEFYRSLWAALVSGCEWRGEFPNRRKDGELYWELASISPIKNAQGETTHFVKVAEDVSERKRAEEALQQRSAELQARNEELDAFAHTVAHDLKNPLGLLVGFAELLVDVHEDLPAEEVQQHLCTIARVGRKMTNIVDELLLLAGVRNKEVEPSQLDMQTLVTGAQERLRDLIEERQAEVILPDRWPVALGYGPWVEEVWMNYLSNALKYGGRPPRVELGADVQEGGMVRFWVRDNGAGLQQEQMERLFTPFTQLGQVESGGHGLGLSIVRRIVERLGGQVGVESSGVPGQGSVFSFTLPAAVREA